MNPFNLSNHPRPASRPVRRSWLRRLAETLFHLLITLGLIAALIWVLVHKDDRYRELLGSPNRETVKPTNYYRR